MPEIEEVEEVSQNADEKDLDVTESEVVDSPEDEVSPPEEEIII